MSGLTCRDSLTILRENESIMGFNLRSEKVFGISYPALTKGISFHLMKEPDRFLAK